MDVRLSAEQEAFRDSVAQVVERLGPQAVAQIGEIERTTRLDAAVVESGWRELRAATDDGRPLASGVEAAVVAEELGRAVADTPFVGPTLALELRRLSGAPLGPARETVVFDQRVRSIAVVDPSLGAPGIAVDAHGAQAALLLVAVDGGHRLAQVDLADELGGPDLTRPAMTIDSSAGVRMVDGADRPISEEALRRWRALGLALSCADLVGVMLGAVRLSCDYAAQRRQYGAPIGSFQAVAHLLADAFVVMEGSRSVTLHAAWAVDALPAAEALAASTLAKAYCARSARTVCETAIQVHGGIGHTWECMAHIYLRRALLSIDLLGDDRDSLAQVLEHEKESGAAMDFDDSPEEAEFRQRLRAWLVEHNPGLPTSSTDDAYWAGMAAWHRALYDAGFFALSWPTEIGGHGRSAVLEVIVDEELAAAGAPPRPSPGYLVRGILEHGSAAVQQRFLPGIVNGRDRWCQGFSEPDAGSDLAALRTRADLEGDDYVIVGQKIWTSYSDEADWCLLLARTDHDVRPHRGISAFVAPMRQPGIEQRPLRMINGVTKEFGEVHFDGARVPAGNMIGQRGEGWALAMTVVSHEREPGELGYVSRYAKLVNDLAARVRIDPTAFEPEQVRELGWAMVEVEMLRRHVQRRLSDRLDGISHGPEGSVDKLLMTWVEQAVGHAALAVGGIAHGGGDDTWLNAYLYSRAQSVMGGTSQIQRNLVAGRILGLPPS